MLIVNYCNKQWANFNSLNTITFKDKNEFFLISNVVFDESIDYRNLRQLLYEVLISIDR